MVLLAFIKPSALSMLLKVHANLYKKQDDSDATLIFHEQKYEKMMWHLDIGIKVASKCT